MVISAILLAIGFLGCFRYLTTPHNSSYAQRIFRAYSINLIVAVGIPLLADRTLLLMMLPAFYALLFLGSELKNSVDDSSLENKYLIFEGFTKYVLLSYIFTGLFTLYMMETK
jgi:hypothetical protein